MPSRATASVDETLELVVDRNVDSARTEHHLYDKTMKLLVEDDLPTMFRAFGVPTGDRMTSQPTVYPSNQRIADLLVQVDEGQLAHVEYMRSAEKKMTVRMLRYRADIMERHPDKLVTQHIVVLDDGTISGHDELERLGFSLKINVVYLRKLSPEPFLKDPNLAPLATLCRNTGRDLEGVFLEASLLIVMKGGSRSQKLIDRTNKLATVIFPASVIEKLIEEAAMTIETYNEIIANTSVGRGLVRQGEELGREQGREQGLEQGREQERVKLFTSLLRDRFGDMPEATTTAQRLADWADSTQALHAITAASSIGGIPATQPN